MNAMDKMKESRRRIMLKWPEFSPILFPLKLEEADPALDIMGTAYTDGKVIGFNSGFVDGLLCETCGNDRCQHDTLQLHEAFHVALLHVFSQRAKWLNEKDLMAFWQACDHVVNNILEEAGLHALPKATWLCDKKYQGWALEAVFEDIRKQQQGKGKQGFDTHIILGDGSELSEKQKQEIQQQIKQWQKALADMLTIAKQRGTMGAGLEKLVNESLEPKIPWTRILINSLQRRLGRSETTWSRPSRRGRVLDVYLPSTYDLQVECVVFCFDTSGSMWCDPLLAQGFSELKALCGEMRVKRTILIEADVGISREEEITDTTLLSTEIKGGGGTSFVEALEKADTYEPVLIVYFTDLDGTFPPEGNIQSPVLWVTASTKTSPPFGEVLIVN